MAAKKPPRIVVDTSGVYVKIPNVSPEVAELAAALFEGLSSLVGNVRNVAATAERLEGHATRALARPRRRPRARRR